MRGVFVGNNQGRPHARDDGAKVCAGGSGAGDGGGPRRCSRRGPTTWRIACGCTTCSFYARFALLAWAWRNRACLCAMARWRETHRVGGSRVVRHRGGRLGVRTHGHRPALQGARKRCGAVAQCVDAMTTRRAIGRGTLSSTRCANLSRDNRGCGSAAPSVVGQARARRSCAVVIMRRCRRSMAAMRTDASQDRGGGWRNAVRIAPFPCRKPGGAGCAPVLNSPAPRVNARVPP